MGMGHGPIEAAAATPGRVARRPSSLCRKWVEAENGATKSLGRNVWHPTLQPRRCQTYERTAAIGPPPPLLPSLPLSQPSLFTFVTLSRCLSCSRGPGSAMLRGAHLAYQSPKGECNTARPLSLSTIHTTRSVLRPQYLSILLGRYTHCNTATAHPLFLPLIHKSHHTRSPSSYNRRPPRRWVERHSASVPTAHCCHCNPATSPSLASIPVTIPFTTVREAELSGVPCSQRLL